MPSGTVLTQIGPLPMTSRISRFITSVILNFVLENVERNGNLTIRNYFNADEKQFLSAKPFQIHLYFDNGIREEKRSDFKIKSI